MSQRLTGHFVYRLIPPRPTFDQDMSEDERGTMAQHAEYWAGQMEIGKVVVYGPVRDSTGAWGLGVLKADSEEEARALVVNDPAISSGMATFEFGAMPVAVVPD
ncbi:MAG: YciI family protein [Solirubrobacteraceae bacterium]